MAVIRRNIVSNSSVRDKYIEGVKLLKNDFLHSDWPNTYDVFIIWHFHSMMTQTPPSSGSGRNAAHRGPAFLPWHRWLLILLEHHLQRVLNDTNFGLPYWNWAADGELTASQQRNAAIWANNCMGGSGSPVITGPFRSGQWQVNIEQGFAPGSINPTLVSVRRPLRRALGSGSSRLPTKIEVRKAVRTGSPKVIYDSPPWDINSTGFRNELEGWPNGPTNHNKVHVWVGGDMGPATSPNDPVFYLNHCNVDRIWAGWQQLFQNPKYVPNSSASATLRRHRLNDLLFPVTEDTMFDPIYHGRVRPSNLLNISSRYTYDTFADL